MIDESAITQWRKQKPWDSIAQVEQDLLICRSLVAIYSDDFLVNNMESKMNDAEFLGDTIGLLRPELPFDPIAAYQLVKETLIDRMQ